eukprot:COSAG02_NODE_38855_length_424_cov_0.636923_1_plen_89_part_00
MPLFYANRHFPHLGPLVDSFIHVEIHVLRVVLVVNLKQKHLFEEVFKRDDTLPAYHVREVDNSQKSTRTQAHPNTRTVLSHIWHTQRR